MENAGADSAEATSATRSNDALPAFSGIPSIVRALEGRCSEAQRAMLSEAWVSGINALCSGADVNHAEGARAPLYCRNRQRNRSNQGRRVREER